MSTSADLLILGFLARKPMHGYEIRQALDESAVENWTSISTAHIYWVLSKLEREGLVEVAIEQEGNRPPRKKYSLTPKGKESALGILREGVGVQQMIYSDLDIVLIVMGMLPQISQEERMQILLKRREFVERLIERAETVWVNSSRTYKQLPAVRAVYEHRMAALQTELDWVSKVIDQIETMGWDRFYIAAPLTATSR